MTGAPSEPLGGEGKAKMGVAEPLAVLNPCIQVVSQFSSEDMHHFEPDVRLNLYHR